MNEPDAAGGATDRDGGTTLTDEEIETRPLATWVGGPASSADDDTGDAGDTGDDSGDASDTSDTGDDSGDVSDTGDDSGDGGDGGVA
jgi:hypothetical protein